MLQNTQTVGTERMINIVSRSVEVLYTILVQEIEDHPIGNCLGPYSAPTCLATGVAEQNWPYTLSPDTTRPGLSNLESRATCLIG